jgi:hypothetical protein
MAPTSTESRKPNDRSYERASSARHARREGEGRHRLEFRARKDRGPVLLTSGSCDHLVQFSKAGSSAIKDVIADDRLMSHG